MTASGTMRTKAARLAMSAYSTHRYALTTNLLPASALTGLEETPVSLFHRFSVPTM